MHFELVEDDTFTFSCPGIITRTVVLLETTAGFEPSAFQPSLLTVLVQFVIQSLSVF